VSGPPEARPGARQRRHLALVHPDDAAVALLRTPAGDLALPAVDVAWDFASAVPTPLPGDGRAAPRHAVLACLAEVEDDAPPPPGRVERLLWAEAMPGSAAAVDGWWRGDADAPAGLPAGLLPALRSALAGFDEPGAAAWPPFASRGATAALAAALSGDAGARDVATFDRGHPRELRQLRAWSLSSVWSNGAVFVKLGPPRWAAEGGVTAWLADVAPGRVPRVVAHGHAAGPAGSLPWFVQAAAPKGAFGASVRERCAAAIGDVVRRVDGELPGGRARGLDDRTPAAVAAGLAEVWASPELAALDAAERARLPELDARLRRRLAALDAADLPQVLVHGDLHDGNVLPGGDGPAGDAVIDWTDAAVGWPGADLLTLLGLDAALDDGAAERAVVAYAEAAGPALGRRGADAVRLGLGAAAAFHALSYARIEASTPPSQRWHVEGVVRYLVRRMLRDEGLS
jgi:hypothetical protein